MKFYETLYTENYDPSGKIQYLMIANHQTITDSLSLFCLLDDRCPNPEIAQKVQAKESGLYSKMTDAYEDVLKIISHAIKKKLLSINSPEILPGQKKNKMLLEEIQGLLEPQPIEFIYGSTGYFYVLRDKDNN